MTGSAADQLDEAEFDAVYSKVSWRIMPVLFFSFVASFLDRVNVGFAKLQMMSDLNFSDTVYGLGAGIFFLGYFLFEVPSNIILHKVGARIWIARIMITWGIISAAMVFVSSAHTFYLLRFLLGLSEAGFFPGVILYITYWYPAERRGRMYAVFMAAVAVSGIIGGPVSGSIMHGMPGIWGLAGWQWMFLLEALPSIVLGLVIFMYLQDRIADAPWLSVSERALLAGRIAQEEQTKTHMKLTELLVSVRLWHMALIYFSLVMGLYGVSFWLPTLIKLSGVTDTWHIGLLTMIPYFVAAVGMVLIGKSADRSGERRWHLIVPSVLGSAALLLSTVFDQNTLLALLCLTVAMTGILSALAVFWSLPTALLGGAAAAAGIALVNSLGNLAGFVGPYLIGWLKDLTHSTAAGLITVAMVMLLGAALTGMVPTAKSSKSV